MLKLIVFILLVIYIIFIKRKLNDKMVWEINMYEKYNNFDF